MKERVEVAIADAGLARAVREAIDAAVSRAARLPRSRPPVVRLRTRRRLAALGEDAVRGAIVVVRVTAAGARRLTELVDAVRALAPAGVQLVWDGVDPAPPAVERHVFAALERARATPAGPPLVLARDRAPAKALRILIAARKETTS